MLTSCILWCKNSSYTKFCAKKNNHWPNSMPQVTQDSLCTLHLYSFMWILCNMRIFNNFELMHNCTLNLRPGHDVVHHHCCNLHFGPSDQFQVSKSHKSGTSELAQDVFFSQQKFHISQSWSSEWGNFFKNRKRSLIPIDIFAQARESESHFGKRGNSLSNTCNSEKNIRFTALSKEIYLLKFCSKTEIVLGCQILCFLAIMRPNHSKVAKKLQVHFWKP